MNRSQMFTQYNKAKQAAHNGKLDELRVNRALSVLQSADGEDKLNKYQTTIHNCNCPDRKHHPRQACKHMIAAMIVFRSSQQQAAQQPVSKPASKPVDNPYVNIEPTGQVVMAEQKSGFYNLHIFESLEQYVAWRNQHTNVFMRKPSRVNGRKNDTVDHREF